MNYMNILSLLSIVINIILILAILIRSPNEQSLQENLDPFKLFESSSKAEKSIDKFIKILAIIYFILALFYAIQSYF
uniref:hypothetical protein n=1 Tax=Halosiphon tomentosus TaxID=64927 RepID=UPI002E78EF15|nr:hypothetical protein V2488_pgp056 [Halosiphon tomentosus]WAM63765.1 hypothetical protein [Halosiphon tomentosus]